MLPLIPCRPDAELRTTARDDVERSDDLGKQTGMAVGDTGDEEPQRDAFCPAGEKAERGVALQHRIPRTGELLHLKPVVHHREG